MYVLEYVRKFNELSRYDASFNELIDQCLVIKQADQEKKEEKRTNKEIVDQGNFLTNHGKPRSNNNKRKRTPMAPNQNKNERIKNH